MKTDKRKTLQAKVISDKMDKSIVVTMNARIPNLKYGKYLNRRTKIAVHDEKNLAKVGNTVLIEECKPISKLKSWTLIKVLD